MRWYRRGYAIASSHGIGVHSHASARKVGETPLHGSRKRGRPHQTAGRQRQPTRLDILCAYGVLGCDSQRWVGSAHCLHVHTCDLAGLPCLHAEEEREFIEQVVVHLHPTFRPSTLVLSEPGNFRVRRLGWGFFVVHAEIMLRPEWGGRTLALHWLLDFEGAALLMRGSWHGASLPAASDAAAAAALAVQTAHNPSC